MTEEDKKYIKFLADLINSATDFELQNEKRTKEQIIEMKEYKQYLRDIDLYDYYLKPYPYFFKLSSAYKYVIDGYKEKNNITFELDFEL